MANATAVLGKTTAAVLSGTVGTRGRKTMPRLIDADALGIGKASRDVFEKPGYADGWNSAVKVIENAPTIDPESLPEVKRLREVVARMSELLPACVDCEGKTTLGERTEACVYSRESIDGLVYCANRGVENTIRLLDENRTLKEARPHGRWVSLEPDYMRADKVSVRIVAKKMDEEEV